MSFEISDIPSLDTSSHMMELSRFTCLERPGLGVLPLVPLFFMAGGTAIGATLTGWLQRPSWSSGEYNDFMRVMDDTFKEWDKQGWTHGCWGNAELRRQFLSLWSQFSKHYKEHPTITRLTVPPWVLDSEEKPARRIMERLNKECRIEAPGLPPEEPPPEAGGGAKDPLEKLGDILMWGALGVGALFALNVVKTIRDLR